jgi:hypothetical protein
MKRLKKMTIEEHRKIGAALKEIRKCTMALSCQIPSVYGTSSKVGKQSAKVYYGIESLINLLDRQLGVDCPGEYETGIYYLESIAQQLIDQKLAL